MQAVQLPRFRRCNGQWPMGAPPHLLHDENGLVKICRLGIADSRLVVISLLFTELVGVIWSAQLSCCHQNALRLVKEGRTIVTSAADRMLRLPLDQW